jgi:hypothetical protein
VWVKDRAINLVKTIISAKTNVFIGTFITYSPNCDERQIVDGQQRYVTIYILMKCLRDIMMECPDLYNEIFSSKNESDTVARVERFFQELIENKYGEYRLVFRKKEMEEDFDAVIRNGKQSKFKNSQMAKNYTAIKNYLLECKPEDLCDAYLHLRKTVQCSIMECENQVEAYRTFASINGLGQKVEEKYSIINIIFQNLGRADKDICTLIESADKSFIIRYLFNRTGKWTGTKDMINAFTKYIEGKNAEAIVKDILEFGAFDKRCEEYRDKNYLIPIPAMLIVLNHFLSTCEDEKEALVLAKRFSAIFVRMLVCPGADHPRENNTAMVLSKIRVKEDVEELLRFGDTRGRFYYPDDEVFKTRFVTNDMYHSSLNDYILLTLNHAISNSEEFIVRDISVEHILPQRSNENNPLLHTIGNLTLTDSCKNSSMGTRDFAVKKEILHDSIYALNRYFDGVDKWDDEEISKRAEILSDIAVKIWSI